MEIALFDRKDIRSALTMIIALFVAILARIWAALRGSIWISTINAVSKFSKVIILSLEGVR
ncbi:MAG: hypothetical protein RBQ87_08090 [Candidatus Cloacimonadaceae bacterium]|jgi:hypothetical protein|nr:hypothetical protein [Candidatus Cloacimonadaceae bacterium]